MDSTRFQRRASAAWTAIVFRCEATHAGDSERRRLPPILADRFRERLVNRRLDPAPKGFLMHKLWNLQNTPSAACRTSVAAI